MRAMDYICRNCGDVATHIHHVVPRSIGPRWVEEPRNLVPLCTGCHGGWHDRALTLGRDIFEPEELAWLLKHADPVWFDEWYPERELDLPF